MKELAELAPLCHVHAFEPRRGSYESLVSGADQSIAYGQITFHDVALASTPGKRMLNVSRGRYESSFLEPDMDLIRRLGIKGSFDVAAREEVWCTTLDEFARRDGIEAVDYLKLDTQGTELDILRGGEAMLASTLVIKTEVEFVQVYRGQPLFGEVVGHLADRGFRFVGMPVGEIVGEHCAARGVFGKMIRADAVFARREMPPVAELRAAAVLSSIGYKSE